jgi:hypothetical protein
MPEREYDLTIEPNGEVQLHVRGYKGKSCLDAVRLFEQIIGELKSKQTTSEMYEPDEVVRHNIEQRH